MWQRNWGAYFVKAVLAESAEQPWPEISEAEVQNYKNSRLQEWECHIYRLPTPIIVGPEVTAILDITTNKGRCRIYPPFELNEKKEISGTLLEIQIPQGKNEVTSREAIPQSAVTGSLAHQQLGTDSKYCHGLRIDFHSGSDVQAVIRLLLDQVAQYTKQWWLRSSRSPFRGLGVVGAFVDKDFRTMTELRYHGAGEIESTWHGLAFTQNLIGFETPLDPTIWENCYRSLRGGYSAEFGLLTFLDAVSHYMSGDDERCILDLAICFEVLANKRYFLENNRWQSSNKKLLSKNPLLSAETRDIVGHLIIDRDHVSHGRPPYILGQNKRNLEDYLTAILDVVNRYIDQVRGEDNHRLAATKVDSSRR